jgi:hypothetical protein
MLLLNLILNRSDFFNTHAWLQELSALCQWYAIHTANRITMIKPMAVPMRRSFF